MSQPWKRALRLPEGIEILNERDADQRFRTNDPRMDRYTLRDYLKWNKHSNEVCFVYKIEGVIAGILEISVSNDFITIEMVGRNVLVQASAVGTKLMSLAENIARQLGKKEIRLESLDSVVEWYDEHLGYVEYDQPYNDSEFGRLTPKRKLMQV